MTGDRNKLLSEELYDLYSSTNTIWVTQSTGQANARGKDKGEEKSMQEYGGEF